MNKEPITELKTINYNRIAKTAATLEVLNSGANAKVNNRKDKYNQFDIEMQQGKEVIGVKIFNTNITNNDLDDIIKNTSSIKFNRIILLLEESSKLDIDENFLNKILNENKIYISHIKIENMISISRDILHKYKLEKLKNREEEILKNIDIDSQINIQGSRPL